MTAHGSGRPGLLQVDVQAELLAFRGAAILHSQRADAAAALDLVACARSVLGPGATPSAARAAILR